MAIIGGTVSTTLCAPGGMIRCVVAATCKIVSASITDGRETQFHKNARIERGSANTIAIPRSLV